MASQIPQLQAHYIGLNKSQKKEFINKLQQKLAGQKNATEYQAFLNDCIESYNSIAVKAKPKPAPVVKKPVNTIDNLAGKASGLVGNVKNEINTSKTVASVKNRILNEGAGSMAQLRCSNCGRTVVPSQKFCNECFTRIKKPLDKTSLYLTLFGLFGPFIIWLMGFVMAWLPISLMRVFTAVSTVASILAIVSMVYGLILAFKRKNTMNTILAIALGVIGVIRLPIFLTVALFINIFG